MIVVSDSGPLISLMKAGRLSVLHTLYGEVLIPVAVFSELTSNPKYEDEAIEIKSQSFIKVVAVEDRKSVDLLRRATGLDLGESEAIVYADEKEADFLLIEEDAGRKVAQQMRIRVRGSMGVLLFAFDKGILTRDQVEDAIEKLKKTERRISEQIYKFAYDHVRQ